MLGYKEEINFNKLKNSLHFLCKHFFAHSIEVKTSQSIDYYNDDKKWLLFVDMRGSEWQLMSANTIHVCSEVNYRFLIFLSTINL